MFSIPFLERLKLELYSLILMKMAIIGKIPIIPFIFLLIYTPTLCSGHRRKILHQPFFPTEAFPPAAQPPRQQPKYPFSSLFPPSKQNPFFPLSALSPPPPPTTTAAVTFPANISALPLPNPSLKPVSRHLVAVAVSLSLLSAAFITATAAAVLLRRSRKPLWMKTETRRLFPAKPQFSDEPAPPPAPSPAGNRSGEFLYLGTLRGIEENYRPKNGLFSSIATSSAEGYRRLSSPELRPLPPLPRHHPFSSEFSDHEEEEEQFFSPNFSPNNKSNSNDVLNHILSSPKVVSSPNIRNKDISSGNNLFGSSISSSPIDSLSSKSPFIALNLSPRSLISNSPDFQTQPVFENINSNQTHNFPFENHQLSAKTEPHLVQDNPFLARPPPPAPPLPPPRFWELFEPGKGEQVAADDLERGEEESSSKPRLKPLHWDKVRASSDRAMVWDQIRSSSFQLNEEMIETLFMVNNPGSSSRENTPRLAYGRLNQENCVLDPKKSQNIAILLRALNVTVDEVCEALTEGSIDTLGTELLESLLKMAPSKEEERKLKEFKDDSPAKLGPAEKFLKAVLDIPFAFQRVDAMLYVANFDSEVEYLTRSFKTLKAACEELKNSKMFRKLLDAVLQTGNRMNVGTNRGDARAFKLDTLLKLVDIKGTDGKTTLLHFVVQEISRMEGSNMANTNPSSTLVQILESDFSDDIEFRKLGLRVVSGLSRELDNMKKAADMDSNVLGNEVAKLFHGVGKIKEILKLNEEFMKLESGKRFSESMNEFLNRAELEIVKVRNLESESSCSVKEITEYFHGDSGNEEAHRFRIFTVVRDFISILDIVCKEVEKLNGRSFVSSGRQYPLPVHSSFLPVFPGFDTNRCSNDDEISS